MGVWTHPFPTGIFITCSNCLWPPLARPNWPWPFKPDHWTKFLKSLKSDSLHNHTNYMWSHLVWSNWPQLILPSGKYATERDKLSILFVNQVTFERNFTLYNPRNDAISWKRYLNCSGNWNHNKSSSIINNNYYNYLYLAQSQHQKKKKKKKKELNTQYSPKIKQSTNWQ